MQMTAPTSVCHTTAQPLALCKNRSSQYCAVYRGILGQHLSPLYADVVLDPFFIEDLQATDVLVIIPKRRNS
jgi:hypothetical protein